MSRIPEPTPTPQGPMYEGRLLDRADEEVVDQGVAFDLRTLMSRRGLLIGGGLGLGAVVLAACAPGATGSSSTTATPTPSATGTASDTVTEIPDETAGPYPGDGSNGPDVLDEAGIIRQDIRSSIDGGGTADGVPLSFELQILDLANGGVPFAGVAVYAWHCNAQGEYSLYSSGLEDVSYLRGVQVADDDGQVRFTSVCPGCEAAHPLRGVSGCDRDHRRVERDRHVPARAARGRLQCGLCGDGVLRIGGQSRPDLPDLRQRLRRRRRGVAARHDDGERHRRIHRDPRGRRRHDDHAERRRRAHGWRWSSPRKLRFSARGSWIC